MDRENTQSPIATMEGPKKTWHFVITHTQLLRRPGPIIFHCTWLSQYCLIKQALKSPIYPTIRQAYFTSTHCVLSPGTRLICLEFWRASCGWWAGGALHWRPALINLWGRRGWITGTKSLNRRVINDALYCIVRKSPNNKVLYPSKQPEERILTTVFYGNANFLA